MSTQRTGLIPTISDNEINNLVTKLQALLPHSGSICAGGSASNILKEICAYIKKLQEEADDLSTKLSELLGSNDIDADVLTSLLQQ